MLTTYAVADKPKKNYTMRFSAGTMLHSLGYRVQLSGLLAKSKNGGERIEKGEGLTSTTVYCVVVRVAVTLLIQWQLQKKNW